MSKNDPVSSENFTKPVAYDEYGRPLYAHPAETTITTPSLTVEPQVVYMSRSMNPHKQTIPPDVQQKHEESKRRYPQLNLSDGEYVVSAVSRHPIGLISIWVVVALAIIIIIALPAMMLAFGVMPFNLTTSVIFSGTSVLVLVIILAVLGGVIATVVYDANRFFLTNESVIQHIQNGLFNRKDQTISLGNIEDASYRQKGILQTLLNYGSTRLSTEGEETTYQFYFVANPREQIRLINNAIEAFKNYRPVDYDDQD